MIEYGTLKSWKADRGYGWIEPDFKNPNFSEIFVHRNQIISGDPYQGARISFIAKMHKTRANLVADKATILD
jgi:cold shock CspA family protein